MEERLVPAEDTGSLRSSPALPELEEYDLEAVAGGHGVGLCEKETRPPISQCLLVWCSLSYMGNLISKLLVKKWRWSESVGNRRRRW